MKKKLLSTFYKQLSIPNEVQVLNNKQNDFIIKGSLGWTSVPFNITNFLLNNRIVPKKDSLTTERNDKNNLINNKSIDNFCRYNVRADKLCFLFPYLTFYSPKIDSLVESSHFRSKFGHLKTQIKNQIKGVQEAFVITLKLNGLGYKASLSFINQKKKKCNLPKNFDFTFLEKNGITKIGKSPTTQCLILDLGFSHVISYKIPLEILLFISKSDIISIYGLDKSLVSQFASEIKDLKRPESFTGKGIFYTNEIFKIKSGKKS